MIAPLGDSVGAGLDEGTVDIEGTTDIVDLGLGVFVVIFIKIGWNSQVTSLSRGLNQEI